MKKLKTVVCEETKSMFGYKKTYLLKSNNVIVGFIKTSIDERIDNGYAVYVESFIKNGEDYEPLNRRVSNNKLTLTEARKLRTKFVNEIKPNVYSFLNK
ncbi:MAG: hypothetical protein R3230_01050 [Nitrosopumilaceae archaeon]|nr:hypothetical protein [Nitrosopumilaceae archaeon]